MPLDDFEHMFDNGMIEVMIGESGKYTDEKVMDFMDKNFGDNNEVYAKDINIKNAEDFVFLILATIKSTSRVSFYKAKRDEDEIDINVDVNEDYNVPNFLYVKKGE